MRVLRLSPVLLGAVVLVAACGGGSDSSADSPASPTATVVVTVTPTPTGAKPAATAKPSTAPTAGGATVAPTKAAATPKATPAPAKKPAYRVAMPDGRTAPVEADFTFKNLHLESHNTRLSGTVDVAYNGPGLASALFTVATTVTNCSADGAQCFTSNPTFKGSVSAIRAGATENVNLGGGADTIFYNDSSTYEGVYSIDEMSDDDPKARAH